MLFDRRTPAVSRRAKSSAVCRRLASHSDDGATLATASVVPFSGVPTALFTREQVPLPVARVKDPCVSHHVSDSFF